MEHLYAIIDLLKLTLEKNYKYVHIISGEDFPACSTDKIINFFQSTNQVYCECTPAVQGVSKRIRFYRYYWPYTKYHMNYKNKYIRFLNLAFVAVQVVVPAFNRKKLGEFKNVYGGLIWGSYPRDVIEYCINYLENHKEFCKQLVTCKIPEELCFQTIIMNSEYKDRIAEDRRRYENWMVGDGWGPVYLEVTDLKKIDDKQAFFVRKIKNNSPLMRELLERQEVDKNTE